MHVVQLLKSPFATVYALVPHLSGLWLTGHYAMRVTLRQNPKGQGSSWGVPVFPSAPELQGLDFTCSSKVGTWVTVALFML